MSLDALLAAQDSADGLVFVEQKVAELAIEPREFALAALDPCLREARRAAAKSVPAETLERFAAVYTNPEAAVNAVRNHVKWLCEPREPAATTALWVGGRSMDGDAVIVLESEEWHPWEFGDTNAECSKAWCDAAAHCFDVACRVADAPLGSGKFVILVRMSDRRSLLRPVALRCVYAVVGLLDHYPGRLARAYLLGAPPLFATAWAVIRHWLDQDTLDRTVFVPPDDVQATIRAFPLGKPPRDFFKDPEK
ncbi:hypothetical protein CTAYLR_010489 [Chrysophaeum taylorii]|uniref:CRAL-TRIO domain-containing protein n=1 Tax=Chrysophaeum taylorii TaxID=2483200 RepID=A0AAD7U718_9STRA|nr:hypothetical protein CTAYLR_010489 [Chrysophaeum taylorii]